MKNIIIEVNNPALSEVVQKLLFSKGVKWGGRDSQVKHTNYSYLGVNAGSLDAAHGTDAFRMPDAPVVSAATQFGKLLELIKETKSVKLNDKLTATVTSTLVETTGGYRFTLDEAKRVLDAITAPRKPVLQPVMPLSRNYNTTSAKQRVAFLDVAFALGLKWHGEIGWTGDKVEASYAFVTYPTVQVHWECRSLSGNCLDSAFNVAQFGVDAGTCLQQLAGPELVNVRIGDYTAKIGEKQTVIGCQTFENKNLLALGELLNDYNKLGKLTY